MISTCQRLIDETDRLIAANAAAIAALRKLWSATIIGILLLFVSSAHAQQSIVTAEYARGNQQITYILDEDVFQPGDFVVVGIWRWVNNAPVFGMWLSSEWAQPGTSHYTFAALSGENSNVLMSVETWNGDQRKDMAWFWVMQPNNRGDLNFAKGRERIENGSYLSIQLLGMNYVTHPGEIMGKLVGITYLQNASGCYPSLWIDDDKVAQGATVPCGSNQNLVVFTASQTGRQREDRRNIVASGHHGLVLRMLPTTPGVARFIKGKRDWWERHYGTSNSEVSKRYILALVGYLYYSAKGEAELNIAARTGGSYRTWLSSALVSNPNPSTTFMDVRSPGISGGNGDFWNASGWVSSRLESSVISDTMGTDAVSTVRLLEAAKKKNEPIYQIDPFGSIPTANLVSGGWQQGELVLLHQWVNAGWSAMVPARVQQIGSWRGIGMYIYDIPSGYGAAIISGNLGSRTGKKPIVIRGGFKASTSPLTAALFEPGLNAMDVGDFNYFGGWADGYIQEAAASFRDLSMDIETGVQIAVGPLVVGLVRGILLVAPEAPAALAYIASRGWFQQGYLSFSTFKRILGTVPQTQWHHIVRQYPDNIVRFGYEQIHHPMNLIRLPDSVHSAITTFYRHPRPELTGTAEVLNTWILKQSYQVQYEIGIRVLQLQGVTNLPRP